MKNNKEKSVKGKHKLVLLITKLIHLSIQGYRIYCLWSTCFQNSHIQ